MPTIIHTSGTLKNVLKTLARISNTAGKYLFNFFLKIHRHRISPGWRRPLFPRPTPVPREFPKWDKGSTLSDTGIAR